MTTVLLKNVFRVTDRHIIFFYDYDYEKMRLIKFNLVILCCLL